jgi:soluble P-type ATPase
MLEVAIPGMETLRLAHLVADFNGTLAMDGALLPGVTEALSSLRTNLDIHVVTADTFGRARQSLAGIPCNLLIIPIGGQVAAKLRYVESLGAAQCVCIGNGRNDRLMLAAAGLGIAVMQAGGRSTRCWPPKS